MRRTLVICATLAIGACASDPNAVSMDMNGNTLTGSYDPAGWTGQEIQTFAAVQCPTRKVASYSETPTSSGRVAFTLVCETAT